MKKFIFFILCICMTITASASSSDQYQFEYEDQGITILFDEDTTFSSYERQYIADLLVYDNVNAEGATTYAWCWLTGHDLVSDSVIEIQHKVTVDAPRCLRTIYEVITCSKCDHMETNSLGSVFIDCCPED